MNGNRRSSRLVWLLGLVLLAGTVVGAGWALNTSHAGARPGKDQEPASPNNFGPATFIGFGDVENGVTAISPVQPGKVVEVLAKESKEFKAGEVLFRMDSAPARAILEEAEADLKLAEEQLAQAQKLPKQEWEDKIKQQKIAIRTAQHQVDAARANRDDALNKVRKQLANAFQGTAARELVKQLESKLELEKARLDELQHTDYQAKARQAERAVAVKKAKVEQARLAVKECDVVAPVDGEVLRVQVTKGEVLGAQPRHAPVLFCPNAKERIVRTEVEQEYAARVAVGKPAVIEDDTRQGDRWTGKVIRLSDWYTHRRSIIQEPKIFNDVRTLECIVALDPGQKLPRIGQRLRVTIGGPKR